MAHRWRSWFPVVGALALLLPARVAGEVRPSPAPLAHFADLPVRNMNRVSVRFTNTLYGSQKRMRFIPTVVLRTSGRAASASRFEPFERAGEFAYVSQFRVSTPSMKALIDVMAAFPCVRDTAPSDGRVAVTLVDSAGADWRGLQLAPDRGCLDSLGARLLEALHHEPAARSELRELFCQMHVKPDPLPSIADSSVVVRVPRVVASTDPEEVLGELIVENRGKIALAGPIDVGLRFHPDDDAALTMDYPWTRRDFGREAMRYVRVSDVSFPPGARLRRLVRLYRPTGASVRLVRSMVLYGPGGR